MNNELNKKLAEWTGTTAEDKRWYPNFTESLDACFKWLVPKLVQLIGIARTTAFLQEWVDEIIVPSLTITPALALCLAIEKLIDEEVESEHRSGTNNS